MNLTLDIETVADKANQALVNSFLSGIEPDKRLVDLNKIAEDINKKTVKVVSDFGLSPLTGKIAGFSYSLSEGIEGASFQGNFFDDDEVKVLTALRKELEFPEVDFRRIVTFNGNSFDIPFIITRCAINKIGCRLTLPRKYNLNPNFDVRAALTGFDSYAKGTLKQWALAFGIKYPDEVAQFDGVDVQTLWDAGSKAIVAQKCDADVSVTEQLFYRIKDYYGN